MCLCHYSHNHLLDFSLIVTGSKVRLSIAFFLPLGCDLQNVLLHLWEATKQLELGFEVVPLPHVVYFASFRLHQECRVHALECTPNVNLSPFSSSVLTRRGSCLYAFIAFPFATTAGCCPGVLSPPLTKVQD